MYMYICVYLSVYVYMYIWRWGKATDELAAADDVEKNTSGEEESVASSNALADALKAQQLAKKMKESLEA